MTKTAAQQAPLWQAEPVLVPIERPTPVHSVRVNGATYWLKRDDYYTEAGVHGGKVRTCGVLARRHVQAGRQGLVTAGSRQSPQVNIVAHLARKYGVGCRVHIPASKRALTPELVEAGMCGAEIIEHAPGYNTVIVARAARDAEALGWGLIPFGMEDPEAVTQTASEFAAMWTASDPEWRANLNRIVVPVGSGMSFAGVLWGLALLSSSHPELGPWPRVLGVTVGANPQKRLDTYAPSGWQSADRVALIGSRYDYHEHYPEPVFAGVRLDPVYEAKCLDYLEPNDLLWIVGIRETARA